MLHSILKIAGQLLSRGKLSILIYHQVVADFDPMRPNEPTAEVFDWQMALLARYFTPLSLTDAVQRLAAGTLPANAVCVTFDDGYLNNLTVAQPILAKYSIPATVYVATAFRSGDNMWNDRIQDLCADLNRTELKTTEQVMPLGDWPSRRDAASQLLKKLKYLPVTERLQAVDELYRLNQATEYPARMMNDSQLQKLSSLGISIGAHTHNHPILKSLDAKAQQTEIELSKSLLEQILQQPVEHFAYPNGVEGRDFDDVAVQWVAAAGFKSAVMTNWGYSTAATLPLRLKRFTPWDQHPLKFHLRLVKNYLS
jgi:peptidoglycan/xylan/chitin deacetylase (PgdA/CDA1 family)